MNCEQPESEESSPLLPSYYPTDVMSSVPGFRSKPKHDRTNYMPVSGQVQNAQNSTVYVFGGSDIAEDEINKEDKIEMSELRTRGGDGGKQKKKTKNTEDEEMVFVEKDINEGDTLQTFSLRYGCRVRIVSQ